ncbi:MAG: Gldg family protein [Gammaproteobacteria bacterium]|nr:Gldg family protein [Gammaproteobacteria bacterium]
MNRIIYSGTGLALLLCAFLVFTVLNNLLFSSLRLDLTENKLYTLSSGSRQIIESIDEPINIYFFFSEKASADLTGLRTYAKRVEELLQEYEFYADGKILLHLVNPEPFSEAEDQAAEFGLQSVPVNNAGEELYFGLTGTNALDDVATIEFFQPDKEEFLEYEISKLLYNLTSPVKPVIGLMSGLKIRGDMDMRTFQSTPPWVVMSQIEQLFEVRDVDLTVTEIPVDISILMMVHPKSLAESTLRAVDQFVLGGGRLVVFIDPLAEMDRPQNNPMMFPEPASQVSELNQLLSAWGLTMRENSILGDAQAALTVSAGASGGTIRHLAILGMSEANLSQQELITASLETINVATAGILDEIEDRTTTISPLIYSSTYAMPMDATQFQFLMDPADLLKGFNATGETYLVAARISGPANTAFPDDGSEESEQNTRLLNSDNINVIVFADTDLLADRMWVQVQNFFGQRIATPWANNGDLVINLLDNFGGSAALIGVRSRGRFTRPFEVVQNLRREAESRNLEKANELQMRLTETEQKLSELEENRKEKSLITLSPEQAQAINEFQEQKLEIRKQLREVRHQLDKDIEDLGSTLKFINIALIPILLTIALLVLNFVARSARNSRS